MAKTQQDIDKDISIIETYKDSIVPTDNVLIKQYFEIMKDFDFEKKEETNINTTKNKNNIFFINQIDIFNLQN